MKTPIPEIRELCVQVLHLCDYVEDLNSLSDLSVVRLKAGQVRGEVARLYGETVQDDMSDLL